MTTSVSYVSLPWLVVLLGLASCALFSRLTKNGKNNFLSVVGFLDKPNRTLGSTKV